LEYASSIRQEFRCPLESAVGARPSRQVRTEVSSELADLAQALDRLIHPVKDSREQGAYDHGGNNHFLDPLIRDTDLVSRDDWSLAEGEFADRSLTNRCGWRWRLGARQVGRNSAANHHERRDSGKKKF
jgi:hypothetical protein